MRATLCQYARPPSEKVEDSREAVLTVEVVGLSTFPVGGFGFLPGGRAESSTRGKIGGWKGVVKAPVRSDWATAAADTAAHAVATPATSGEAGVGGSRW